MQLNPESRVYPGDEFLKETGRWSDRSRGRWPLVVMTFVTDQLLTALAVILAAGATGFVASGEGGAGLPLLYQRIDTLPVLLALVALMLANARLYSGRGTEITETSGLFRALAVIAVVDLLLTGKWAEPATVGLVAGTWVLAAAMLTGGRMMLRGLPFVRQMSVRHVLLVGTGTTANQLAHHFRENRFGRVSVAGTEALDAFLARNGSDIRRLTELLATNRGLAPGRVEVLIAPSAEEWTNARGILRHLEGLGIPAELALPYDGLAQGGARLHRPFGSDMVFLGIDTPRTTAVQVIAKRLIDLSLSLTALVILAPLILVLAVLVRLDGGPALFAQARMARGGRSFSLLKFRTMHVDAEEKLSHILSADPRAREEWQRHQKLAVDPRITTMGRFLRATSLDELPQLINVLKGDMSVVGPRPIVAGNHRNHAGDAAYARSDDFRYYNRFRPGITGLWQVSCRNTSDYSERVRLDRWYARNWSLWLDVVILYKTVSALVRRTGC